MEITLEKNEDLRRETRKRVKRMEREFAKMPDMKVFENTENYNQIIAQVNIPFTALCEHHQVAFSGHASIAYIPQEFLIGLSKFGRIVEYYLNPTIKTIQEKATHKIINTLQEVLKPKGLMVIIKAEHTCISYRGVKKPSLTITSAVQGIFATDMNARLEFLELIK